MYQMLATVPPDLLPVCGSEDSATSLQQCTYHIIVQQYIEAPAHSQETAMFREG